MDKGLIQGSKQHLELDLVLKPDQRLVPGLDQSHVSPGTEMGPGVTQRKNKGLNLKQC